MTMRLLLALLMILSAPLAAAQHLGCAQPAEAAVTADGHAHHAMASTDHHDHQAAVAAASEPAGEDCDNCDLACQAACASVAMPASLTDVLTAAHHPTPDLPQVAGLLLSHPLPLLRPPTLSAA
ncbi:MAG: hypothetical protein KAG82_12515 [Alcanivoracaceae bacterium]|nr:hypothetical protein [Alcanivoracaceae bacterium]